MNTKIKQELFRNKNETEIIKLKESEKYKQYDIVII